MDEVRCFKGDGLPVLRRELLMLLVVASDTFVFCILLVNDSSSTFEDV